MLALFDSLQAVIGSGYWVYCKQMKWVNSLSCRLQKKRFSELSMAHELVTIHAMGFCL